MSVAVLVSLGLVALGLIVGFRAGIHWERVGRKVDELARTDSVPALGGADDHGTEPGQSGAEGNAAHSVPGEPNTRHF